MAINPVQPNIENTKSHIPYREAKGTIKTDKNVKPLPPEGHLVHDSWTMLPKYFLKDIAYEGGKRWFSGKCQRPPAWQTQ